MRYFIVFILFGFLSWTTKTRLADICLPDAGIKTAKMYAVNNAEYYRILEYDRKGNPIKEYLKLLKKTYQHVFINDTLRYTITENLDRGNCPEGEPDADYIDTLFVKKFEKDAGRYLYVQLENKFGLQIEFATSLCLPPI